MEKTLDFIKKNNLYITVGLAVLVIILLLIIYFLSSKYKEITAAMHEMARPFMPTPQDMNAGAVGEVYVKDEKTGEEKPLVGIFIPSTIFNTIGTIKEGRSDSLIVEGTGSNFADKTPRTLTLIFTNSTKTFEKNQLDSYLGKTGLAYLKPGTRILIDGYENIRGKTEFNVKTINILE